MRGGAREAFSELVPQALVTDDNRRVARESDLVLLAVKPPHLPAVFTELVPVRPDCLVVSIAAGVTLAQLSAGLKTSRNVRVMPNAACLIGQGAAGFCRGEGATEDDATCVRHLLEAVGRAWELPETLLDAVTGLSGSGPAFVFLFIEALSDGGVQMGLSREVALELAAQTVQGAANLILQTGDHPAVLKDRVASPGGTTIAGLQALESRAFRGAVMAAVEAATVRSRQLGQ